jgi:CRISPR-associated protein Csb2
VLIFGIRYLNGFVSASEPDNYDRAEWPPHPGRIFMALAAAHFQTGGDHEERKALLWLEGLGSESRPLPPQIVASNESQRQIVTHYVPVNDKTGPSKALLQSAPLTRDRQPRTFARAWLDSDTVFLIWPTVELEERVGLALDRLCGKVTRIGHSSSFVQMWIAKPAEVSEPNWLPQEDATVRLRVASTGTLEYLERRYNAAAIETFSSLKTAAADDSDKKSQNAAKRRLREEFSNGPPSQLRPELSYYHGYAPAARSRERFTAPGTVFSPHLITVQLEHYDGPYRHLDLSCVLIITQRWREALLSESNDLAPAVRRLLSGHDTNGGPLEGAHLAFVPLAFVGHEHSGGHLVGMALALPVAVSGEDRRGVLKAIGRVRHLRLGRLGVWRVETVMETRPALNFREETWTGYPNGATHWSTVTPVVYDRHPKTKSKADYQTDVAAMIGECCARIGLPVPREIVVTPVSAHFGTPPAFAFPRLHRKDGSARRHTHAILIFEQHVCGPMLLGAGRYRGYGLCRPMNSGVTWKDGR